jgi:hypothetical protein
LTSLANPRAPAGSGRYRGVLLPFVVHARGGVPPSVNPTDRPAALICFTTWVAGLGTMGIAAPVKVQRVAPPVPVPNTLPLLRARCATPGPVILLAEPSRFHRTTC